MNHKTQLKKLGFSGEVKENEILTPYLTYRIGGPADFLLLPKKDSDLKIAFEFANTHKIPITILGSGSNVLVRDGGIEGFVLYYGPELEGEISIVGKQGNKVIIEASASCTKAQLLEFSIKNNLSGLEFSAGIPGTLGGAVYMNAGTKWGAYSDVLEKVYFYQHKKGFYEKSVEELGLKYRGHGEGTFNDGTIVVKIRVSLRADVPSHEIQNKVDEILIYRGQRQPLERPSCGSVFKNPENSEKGAGRLIEACNLKGTKIGQAQISLKHANFILNLGGAKSSDVEALIELAQKNVRERYNVLLYPEVIVLGRKSQNK